MNKVLIVYGTGSGNTQLVVDAIAEGLVESGLEVKALRGEQVLKKDAELREELLSYSLVLLACSTWNVGQLQDYYAPFVKELGKLQLPQHKFAVVGLGDSKNYDIFCGAADILQQTVEQVGGQLIAPTLRVDGPPHAKLVEFKQWGIDLAGILNQ